MSFDSLEMCSVDSVEAFNSLYPSLMAYLQNNPILDPKISRLILVRHAESESNVTGDVAGRTLDVALTNHGVQQGIMISELLVHLLDKVAVIYTSPTKRTVQTAEIIQENWNKKKSANSLQILTQPNLVEKFYGSLEGSIASTYQVYRKKQEEESKSLKSFKEKFAYKLVADMESLEEIYQRVYPTLLSIAHSHLNQNIIITTHNGVMKALLMAEIAQNKKAVLDYHLFNVNNTSILLFESDGKQLILKAVHAIKFIA